MTGSLGRDLGVILVAVFMVTSVAAVGGLARTGSASTPTATASPTSTVTPTTTATPTATPTTSPTPTATPTPTPTSTPTPTPTPTSSESSTTEATSTSVFITGSLTYADGTPVDGRAIWATSGGILNQTFTTDGNFSLSVVPNETYNVFYRQDNETTAAFAPRDGRPDIHAIGEVSVGTTNESVGPVELPNASLVNVTVLNESGAPITGTDVHVSQSTNGATAFGTAVTDGSGTAAWQGADQAGLELDGTVTISIPPQSGYESNFTELTVSENRSLTVTLHPLVNVSGRIDQPGGTPAGDNVLTFVGRFGTDDHAFNVTTDDGEYTVALRENGTYDMGYRQDPSNATAVDYPKDGTVDLFGIDRVSFSTDRSEFNQTLPVGHNLTVSVVNESGHPVPNATVHVAHHKDIQGTDDAVHVGAHAETNKSGDLVYPGSDGPGFEVNGTVHVNVDPLEEGLSPNGTTVDVTGDRHLTLTLHRTVAVNGTIEYANGSGPEGYTVSLWGDEPGGETEVIAADGRFNLSVRENQTYRFGFEQTDWDGPAADFPRDGNPDVHAFRTVAVGTEPKSLGTNVLPAAHVLNVSVVNATGAPVGEATVDVAHRNNDSAAFVHGETTGEGHLLLNGADVPGVEVNGTVEVHVTPPTGSGLAENGTRVNVTADTNVTVVLSSPTTVSGQLQEADGSNATDDAVLLFGAGPRPGSTDSALTNDTGQFVVAADRNATYDLLYYQFNFTDPETDAFARDGSPDIYAVGRVDTGNGSVDIGPRSLPDASVLNVTVVNESDVPVENATVTIEHRNPDDPAVAGIALPTNGDGQFDFNATGELGDSPPPGIEVAGNVSVVVTPPANDTRFEDTEYSQELNVTKDTNLTVVLNESGDTTIGSRIETCVVIDEPGSYVLNQTLTSSTAGACIEITASDVVLDGQGFAIEASSSGEAVNISSSGSISNVTVRNLRVEGGATGIAVYAPADGAFVDVTLVDNVVNGTTDGVVFTADGNESVVSLDIEGNRVTNASDDGIDIDVDGDDSAIAVAVTGNHINASWEGIEDIEADGMNSSLAVAIVGNAINGQSGDAIEDVTADADNQTVDVVLHDNRLEADADAVDDIDADGDGTALNVSIVNNTIRVGSEGFDDIDAWDDNQTVDVYIAGNDITAGSDGIEDIDADDTNTTAVVTIVGNTIFADDDAINDIDLDGDDSSVSVSVTGNRLDSSTGDGIDGLSATGTNTTTVITVTDNDILVEDDAIGDIYAYDDNQTVDIIIERNTLLSETETGIETIEVLDESRLNLSLSDNLIDADDEGIGTLWLDGHDMTSLVVIENNSITTDSWEGLEGIDAAGRNSSVDLVISNNDIDAGDGAIEELELDATNASVTATIAGNTITAVGNGIEIDGTAAAAEVSVTDNVIHGGSASGILLWGSINASSSIHVERNLVRNNTDGIRLATGVPVESIQITENAIEGNTHAGLVNENGSAVAVNATRNWWGARNGPSGDFVGSGDPVFGRATVVPFYADADRTTLVSGGTPSYSNLRVEPGAVAGGEPINVTVTVTNDEGVPVFERVSLTINGRVVAGQALVLNASERREVSFDRRFHHPSPTEALIEVSVVGLDDSQTVSLAPGRSAEQPEWTSWHLMPENDNYDPGLKPPRPPLYVQWNATVPGEGFNVPMKPIVVNDTVYAFSYESTFALDARTGELLWNNTQVNGTYLGGIAYADGSLFVTTHSGGLYALDATDGSIIWNRDDIDTLNSAPVVLNDTVFVTDDDSDVWAVDTETGSTVWNHSYERTSFPADFSAVTAVNGKVFVPGVGEELFAHDAENGSVLWNRTIGWSDATVAAKSGTVYAADAGADATNLSAIDAETGELIWNATASWSYTGLAVTEDTVFIASCGDSVFAYNATTGEHRWTRQDVGCAYDISEPVAAQSVVYVTAYGENRTFALDQTTGELLYNVTIPGIGKGTSPVPYKGSLYVASRFVTGEIYAIGGNEWPRLAPDTAIEGEPAQLTVLQEHRDEPVPNATVTIDGTTLETGPDGTVTHTFGSPGTYVVRITANDTARHRYVETRRTITVEADVEEPEISPSTDALAYHSVAVDDTATKRFAIVNEGNATLTVNDLRIEGPDAGAFEITQGDGSTTLGTDEGVDVVVSFTPTEIGEKTARVVIESDDPTDPVVNVSLTGQGRTADIHASPETLGFGTVPRGGLETANVTVTNDGFATLDVTGASISGADAFTVVSGRSGSVVPGGTHTITVAFAPGSAGLKSANLSIASNDPDENPLSVTLSGTGTVPDITVSPISRDFGSVPTDSSATRTVTVTNDGNATLVVPAPAISGADPAAFTVVNPTSTMRLLPGESRQVTVSFAPADTGDRTATLSVPSNDPDESTVTVSLAGTGTQSDISIQPSSLPYGEVRVGGTDTGQFTVTNAGTETLDVTGIELAGANPAVFEITSGATAVTLGPGESHTVTVEFSPNETGDRTATVSIASDDPETPQMNVSLGGTGVRPDVSVSTTSVAYADTRVAGDSSRIVTVSNDGNANLTVSGTSLVGADASDFTVGSGGGSFTLRPGEQRNVTVAFTPATAGAKAANLSIASDDPDEDPLNVTLDGTAVTPLVSVNPEALTYGNVTIDTTKTLNVTLGNDANATANLSVRQMVVIGPDRSAFNVTDASFTLKPGQSRVIDVSFTPETGGDNKTATLRILTGDPSVPQIDVWLTNSRTIVDVDRIEPPEPGEQGVSINVTNAPANRTVSANVSQPDSREADVGVDELSINPTVPANFTANVTTDDDSIENFTRTNVSTPIKFIRVNQTIDDSKLANVSFVVRVSKVRLDELDVTPEDFTVYRFHNGTWNELNVTLVRETRTHFLYLVESPGFSEFASGAKKPDFDIAQASVSVSAVRIGESVRIITRITNAEDAADGTFTVNLLLDGSVVSSRDVTIAAGGTRQVTFDRSFGEAGTFTIEVNDALAGQVSVQAADEEGGGTGGGGGGGGGGSGPSGSPSLALGDVSLTASTVEVGDTVEVSGQVVNAGDGAGTFTATFYVNHVPLDRRQVRIPANSSVTVSFSRTFEQAGTFQLGINDMVAGTVTVEEAAVTATPEPGEPTARIAVESVSLQSTSVEAGESVEILATLVNEGNASAEHTATFEVNGVIVAERRVTIPPGESVQVTFTRTFEAAGSYELLVDDELAGTLTVEATPTSRAPTTAGPPATASSPGEGGIIQELPGFGHGAALVALLAFVLLVARRRVRE